MAIDPATGEKEKEIKDEALKARCEADSKRLDALGMLNVTQEGRGDA